MILSRILPEEMIYSPSETFSLISVCLQRWYICAFR